MDTVGRYGGEEFAVVLKDISSENLKKFAETLRILIARSSIDSDDGHEISATVSIGCTKIREDDTVESLVKRADSLMYQAKLSGKNTCRFDQ
jgi:diguanylate cyclase (GGDEF)-like protein